jgi:hypothetical protein
MKPANEYSPLELGLAFIRADPAELAHLSVPIESITPDLIRRTIHSVLPYIIRIPELDSLTLKKLKALGPEELGAISFIVAQLGDITFRIEQLRNLCAPLPTLAEVRAEMARRKTAQQQAAT